MDLNTAIITRPPQTNVPEHVSPFLFEIEGQSSPNVLLRFESGSVSQHPHALSENYALTLEFVSETPLSAKTLLGKKGRLSLGGQNNQYLHGIIAEVTLRPNAPYGYRCCLKLCSPLAPLVHSFHERVFIDKTAPDIIRTHLRAYLDKQGCEYQLQLKETYPTIACWVQHEENDYDNLLRLMNRYGLYFYFDQSDTNATLIITDHTPNTVPSAPLIFGDAESPNLYSLMPAFQRTIDIHIFSDYDAQAPNLPLKSQHNTASGIPGYGTFHHHGQGGTSEHENRWVTRVFQESIDWQRETYHADSTHRDLQPGQIIAITEHPIASYNRAYLIVRVMHYYHQTEDQASNATSHTQKLTNIQEFTNTQASTRPAHPSYHNDLLLIPAETPFRNPEHRPLRQYSAMRGVLESSEHDSLDKNQTGYYRFRYPFDTSDTKDTNPKALTSPQTRFMQIAASANDTCYGMHLPNAPGTEVEIIFLYGNINQPVIVGAIPPEASVVTNQNPYQHRFVTPKGQEWCFDDTPDNEQILLKTSSDTDFFRLQNHPTQPGVTFETRTGAMALQANQDIQFKTSANLRLQANNYHLAIQQDYVLTVEEGIEWRAGENFFLSAEIIELHSSEHTLMSQQNILGSAKTLSFPNAAANYHFLSEQGDLVISAEGLQCAAESALVLEQAGASIRIENNEIHIHSPVEIEWIAEGILLPPNQVREKASVSTSPITKQQTQRKRFSLPSALPASDPNPILNHL